MNQYVRLLAATKKRRARAAAVQQPSLDEENASRRARLRELQRWGVDLSLIEATLAQSPLQRIANMERQLRFVRQLQRARREQEAVLPLLESTLLLRAQRQGERDDNGASAAIEKEVGP